MSRQLSKVVVGATVVLLWGCNQLPQIGNNQAAPSLKIKLLFGSALKEFCTQAEQKISQQPIKLNDGTPIGIICDVRGTGDVVNETIALAQQLKSGTIKAEDPRFPTLISTDGEIYLTQLDYEINRLFPGQKYIPDVTEAPLLASSPMVLMVPENLAAPIQKIANAPYRALVNAKTFKDLDPSAPAQAINFVHTAPNRSNSGLQTLVTQFVEVSGKRPEQLTVADVKQYQNQVAKIQSKVTRYGISTGSLARAMAQNGPFWASLGSVYESSVIEANSNLQPGQTRFKAVYPKSTFSSNMRAILPNAPWVSSAEKEAGEKVIEFLRSPEIQQMASELGLRPGVPGISGSRFSPEFGVDSQPNYDSLRSPRPEVVDAMIKSWVEVVKKPSLVVAVIDSSGSMSGNKLPTVQAALQNYVNSLGPKDKLALIDFDSEVRPPVLIDGSAQGKNKGLEFIAGLKANGGTRLYDATLEARNWLRQNLRPNAINAVIVLTDGEDSGSRVSLDRLSQELQKSGFTSDERIAFFTIGFGNDGEFNAAALQKIAQLNGGYYSKGDPQTIAQVMANLQTEF
ncbi:MAG: VWA domain-containing protein [Cyanobacteria bacterium KgW148]|nr:VWA domain-containing protein [Cyanobacteria bacterium KgW148]